MIVSRTPFRLSFFGGGSDYPVWYKEHGGAVLATSIDKYCYITTRYLPPFFDYKYRFVYSKQEMVNNIAAIQHPAIRGTLKFLRWNRGLGINYDADLPGRIGLGTSSSFTVGLLNALHSLRGEKRAKRQLALEAIHVEQKVIKEKVGTQDQTTAAFGGFNKIIFGGEDEIQVKTITLNPKKVQLLQNHLMLFFTGFARTASEIAAEQIKKTPEKGSELKRMVEMVDEAIRILNGNDITDFGKLLHDSWMLKQSLTSKITTPLINKTYETARKAGAIGGKVCGAGGGGVMIFFVEPENQKRVKEALRDLLYIPFKFEKNGAQIIYQQKEK